MSVPLSSSASEPRTQAEAEAKQGFCWGMRGEKNRPPTVFVNEGNATEKDGRARGLRNPTPRLTREDEQMLLAESSSYRHNGNRLFQTSHFLPALDAYLLALSKCPGTFLVERATIYGNISAVQIRLRNYSDAVTAAERALELRPGWGKALYRRGKGREGVGGWEGLVGAYDDYLRVLGMEVNGKVEGIRMEELEAVKEKVKWLPERIRECRGEDAGDVVEQLEGLRV